jgi:cysteine desulfurase
VREIYADHAGTTAPASEVIAAMQPYLGASFGNPSSVHRRGEAARDAIQAARADVAALIGATPEEIVFTATGSEANNLALQGVMRAERRERDSKRRRLVVSAIEHPSVLETARELESEGFGLTILPVGRDGIVSLHDAAQAIRSDVALVSLMMVNNETGVVQPVRELADLAHAAGARFHTDAVQAVGKTTVDVGLLDADLLSLAGHKFHGPLGAAALHTRRRTRLLPMIHGGHQERTRRAGTENVPAIVGLGVAARRANERLASESMRLATLGDRLLQGLLTRLPQARLNGHRERRLKSIVNLCLPGIDGEALLHELDLSGITISTGSACSAASPGPSHVLVAMGLRPEEAHASVRFSLGESNEATDVDRMIEAVPLAFERIRALAAASRQA